MSKIKNKVHCVNCGSVLEKRRRLREERELDCGKCHFFCRLISLIEGGKYDNDFELDIETAEEPLETFSRFEGADDLHPLLSCPYCGKDMSFRNEDEEHYFCRPCKKNFTPRYNLLTSETSELYTALS